MLKDPESLLFVVGETESSLKSSVNWIIEEDDHIEKILSKFHAQLSMRATSDGTTTHVKLRLARGYLMPPPEMTVSVKEIASKELARISPFAYEISVTQEHLKWFLHKEFSDFSLLHEMLRSQSIHDIGHIPRTALPAFEIHHFFGSSIIINGCVPSFGSTPYLQTAKMRSRKNDKATEHNSTEERLEKYLQALVQLPQSQSNHHILAFLGTCSNSRAEENLQG